jgi:hypothetical protein
MGESTSSTNAFVLYQFGSLTADQVSIVIVSII